VNAGLSGPSICTLGELKDVKSCAENAARHKGWRTTSGDPYATPGRAAGQFDRCRLRLVPDQLRGAEVPEKSYRCYFMQNGRVVVTEVLECDSDAIALVLCRDIHDRSAFETLELWDEARRVAVFTR
jgi:hypothetical protein